MKHRLFSIWCRLSWKYTWQLAMLTILLSIPCPSSAQGNNEIPVLSARPAVEIEWINSDASNELLVSQDGQNWTSLQLDHQTGKKAYWLVSSDELGSSGWIKTQREVTPVSEGDTILIPIEAGIHRVKIESYDSFTDSWNLLTMAHLDGREGKFSFRLPNGLSLQDIRISTHAKPLFNFNIRNNPSQFEGIRIAVPDPEQYAVADDLYLTTTVDGGRDDTTENTTTVEESDIWKLSGSTLYFFNQNRGLQVIDLADLSNPLLTGTYSLPASGDQLYQLSDEHLALITGPDWASTEVLTVDVSGAKPVKSAALPIAGYYRESRLIGDFLYLVTQMSSYRWISSEADGENTGYMQWVTELNFSAIDLSDPTHPVLTDNLILPSYSSTVTATPEHFVIASRDPDNYYRSFIDVISLSDSGTILRNVAHTSVEGRIKDKYKLQLDEEKNMLSIVSEVSRNLTGTLRRYNLLTNYSIVNDSVTGMRKLGELILGQNERLYGTRFAGDYVYIVTFLTIDPLWIVDNSEPSNPMIKGELEIPGFSTYLWSFEDRLLSVGVENRNVAISLFDVSNPEDPGLVQRIYLGDENSYSWSEANYEDKAVGLIPEENLLLVPYYSYTSGEAVKAVQIIDFDPAQDILQKRGSIQHEVSPRRATARGDTIISISATELKTVSAEDRDIPELLANLVLSWNVSQILLKENYVIQLTSRDYWQNNQSKLRITEKSNPDTVIGELDLGTGNILGFDLEGDTLQVLVNDLSASSEYPYPYIHDYVSDETAGKLEISDLLDNPRKLSLYLIDLATPENPALTATIPLPVDNGNYSRSFKLDRLSGNTMVWHTLTNNHNNPYYPLYLDGNGSMSTADGLIGDFYYSPYYYHRNETFYCLKPNSTGMLELQSALSIKADQNRTCSQAYPVGKHLRFGIQVYGRDDSADQLFQACYLTGIDYTYPEIPGILPRTGLPGSLLQITAASNDGFLLFTNQDLYTITDRTSYQGREIQALAFDGINLYHLDSIFLNEDAWSNPAFHDRHMFSFGRSTTDDGELTYVMHHHLLNEMGHFIKLPSFDLETYPQHHLENGHLVLQQDETYLAWNVDQMNLIYENDSVVSSLPVRIPKTNKRLYLNLQNSIYEPGTALWFPARSYGVVKFDALPSIAIDQNIPDSNRIILTQAEDTEPSWQTIDTSVLSYVATINDSSNWRFDPEVTLNLEEIADPDSLTVQEDPSQAFLIKHPALEIGFFGQDDQIYELEFSTDLSSWSLQEQISGQGRAVQRMISLREKNNGFYRLKLVN